MQWVLVTFSWSKVENGEVKKERNDCFWSVVPVKETKLYDVLKCTPFKAACNIESEWTAQKGFNITTTWPRTAACEHGTCSCCNVAPSDYHERVGPNIQRAFPEEFQTNAKDSLQPSSPKSE